MTETLVGRWERQHEAGRRLCSQGELAQAEQAYRAAIQEAHALGDDDLRVATSLTELGQLKCSQGDLEQAEELLSRALAIGERRLGAEHPALTVLLNNLARLYFKRNDYGAATPLLTRLLALKERTLGGEHPEVASIVTALSRVRSLEGNHDEAEALARRALAIRERTLAPTDPAIAASLELLAHYCAARAKREEVWAAASSVLHGGTSESEAHRNSNAICQALREEARMLAERARVIRNQTTARAEPATLEEPTVAPPSRSTHTPETSIPAKPHDPPREEVSDGSSAAELTDHPACAAVNASSVCAGVSSPMDESSHTLGAVPRRDTGVRQRLTGSWRVRRNQVVAASLVVLAANVWVVVGRNGPPAPTTGAHTALSATLPTPPNVNANSSPVAAHPEPIVNEQQSREGQDTVRASHPQTARQPSAPKVPSFSALRLERAIERARTTGLAGVRASVDSAAREIEAAPPTFRNP